MKNYPLARFKRKRGDMDLIPSKTLQSRPGSGFVWTSLILVLLCLGVFYLRGLDAWLINDDEGSFLYQVWRMSEGEAPYQDFLSSRDPLFLYSGAIWMQLWGVSIVPMRGLAVCLTLGTAVLVFLLAQQTLGTDGALLSMMAFLLHPEIFRYGRAFQPEPFYLFFVVLGLYLFTLSQSRKSYVYAAFAGLVFALATLYKLLSILAFGGCVLFLLAKAWRNRSALRQVIVEGLWLVVSFGIVFGVVMIAFILWVPGFYEGVIGLNLAQGSDLSLFQVLSKGLLFVVGYGLSFAPLVLLALPAAWQAWAGRLRLPLAWQLPTAFAFTILSRALFPRLLYYLVPSLVILFIISIRPLRGLEHYKHFYYLLIGVVLIPWAVYNAQWSTLSEDSTLEVVRYIQAATGPQDYVISDYQELNFHARRASTYFGAEISYVIVDGGTITGEKLIAEIEALDVQLIVMDIAPEEGHQLIRLNDYEVFQAYLDSHFVLLDVLPRSTQRLAIYRKLDSE